MTRSIATGPLQETPLAAGVRGAPPALDYIPAVTVEELLAMFSLALDLAEGRAKGHALRVGFVAQALAQTLGMPTSQRLAALHAGLLHDIGAPHASESVSDLGRGFEHELFAGSPLLGPESLAGRIDSRRLVRVTDAFHEHAFDGATAAAALNLPPVVAEAILCHHERHDGGGFPLGLSGNEISPLARIVAVADFAESWLATSSNPLYARRALEPTLREIAGRAFHPQVVDALATLTRDDAFWLGFHGQQLLALITTPAREDIKPLAEPALLRTCATFADIVDARSSYKRGHSRRVALHARALAGAAGLAETHARTVELAGLLHDVGMLRVPVRLIGKPEILSVEEMSLLHAHPFETAEIIRAIPPWAPIAAWAGAHHERLDGRGYPDSLSADEIGIESRMLAIADIYEALTANRPHRPALPPADALRTMRGMAGVNVDPALLTLFEELSARSPEVPQASAS
ncbi:MAG: HD domain-containing protein [Dehalococcoidia bacterium]